MRKSFNSSALHAKRLCTECKYLPELSLSIACLPLLSICRRIIHRDGKEEDKALDPVPWQKPSSGIQSRSAPVIPPSRADTFERLMDDADPSQFDFFL